MVQLVDNLTAYIQEKLIESGLDKRVNVIHVSDHGLADVSPPNVIHLTRFISNDSYKVYGSSPVLQIIPNDAGKYNRIAKELLKISNTNFLLFKNFETRQRKRIVCKFNERSQTERPF